MILFVHAQFLHYLGEDHAFEEVALCLAIVDHYGLVALVQFSQLLVTLEPEFGLDLMEHLLLFCCAQLLVARNLSDQNIQSSFDLAVGHELLVANINLAELLWESFLVLLQEDKPSSGNNSILDELETNEVFK